MIQPIGKKILVKKAAKELKSAGGLFLPDESVDKQFQTRASVVAIGPEVTAVKVDEVVVFAKFAGVEVDDMFFIEEADVLGRDI